MSELKGPAHNQIIDYIKSRKLIEFYTINNLVLKGIIIWYDSDVFYLRLEDGKEITLYKNAIVYYSIA